jgi:type I site-specific restriction endonuclease
MALGKNMKIDRLIPVAKVKKSKSDDDLTLPEQEIAKEETTINEDENKKVSVSLDDFFESLTDTTPAEEPASVESVEVVEPVQIATVTEEVKSESHILDIEKENLEAHVDLCAQRYESLDQRLTKIEGKFGDLQKLIEAGQNSMIKVVIGTAGTVVTGVLSVLFVLLTKTPH